MERRSTKFYRQNEAEVMLKLGLKPTKNSGAGWVEKEDGQNDFLIAQLKSTDAESIRVQQKDWHTLEYNAAVAHKIPLFVIQFLATSEIYIMVKPLDLPSVVQYLECGEYEVPKTEIVAPDEQQVDVEIKTISSSTKSRKTFWNEKEKERQKWQKNSKQNR